MDKDRREFLKTISIIGGTTSLLLSQSLKLESKQNFKYDSSESNDEDFWAWVQRSYTSSPNIINLNNGGVSPQPKYVQDTLETYNRLCNEAPTYYMWQILDQGREPLRAKLAKLAGTSPDEIAICRNTTEALNNVIFGLTFKKDDEVVLCKQDYPNVINSWKQREIRDGIKILWVNLDLPIENDDIIVNKFKEQFTNKTRAVNITHMINWTGQILPARKIADEAKKLGIYVIVDAAHTFAQIDFKIPDLNCDFFGTSLHKWLCAPFGSGLLYINKEKICEVFPLHPNAEPKSSDIRKFEAMGTRSFPIEMAIGQALNFHNSIGTKRKENRLRFLKDFWAKEILKFDRFKLNTSLKSDYSCGLAHFSIDGIKPQDIVKYLFDKYKIHVVAIEWENISGVRITPHLYTKLSDLDRLLEALDELRKS